MPPLFPYVVLAAGVATAAAKGGDDGAGSGSGGKDGAWVCVDGYWVEDGVKSEYTCDGNGKKEDENAKTAKTRCDASTFTDPAMAAFPRICVASAPPNNQRRCWWVHLPATLRDAPEGVTAPLVVDMHGGGGCPSDQMLYSGFKELADSLSRDDTFVVVWPMGHDGLWGTCGADCDAVKQAAEGGKSVADTDDVAFLTDLIAAMVKHAKIANATTSRINPGRVYASGFSMGCMMAHRVTMERSDIVAGVGCHGGMLIHPGDDLAAQQKRFGVQPSAAFMSGGTADAWFMESESMRAWAAWNGCSSTDHTQFLNDTVTLDAVAGGGKGEKGSGTNTAKSVVAQSCKAPTRRFEILDLPHTLDPRMASRAWNVLKTSEERANALGALPDAPQLTADSQIMNDGAAAAPAMLLLMGCMAAAVV